MTEFETGQILAVDWESDGIFCGGHNEDKFVAFIQDRGTRAMVAYAHEHGSICVGFAPYSALSEG